IKLGFNVPAAHLFLGMIYFDNGDPKKAQSHFERAAEDGLPEMKVVAHYYLGVIAFKEGYPDEGSENLLKVEEIAKTVPENKTASSTAANAVSLLDTFRK